jgi:hypothetical protein
LFAHAASSGGLLEYATTPALSTLQEIFDQSPEAQAHSVELDVTKASVPAIDELHVGKLDGDATVNATG